MNERGQWTSASAAAADAACPGRHIAQRGIPEPEKTQDAESGTAIHAALCRGSDGTLTLEQKEVWDDCIKIEQKVIKQFFGDTEALRSFRETRYWIDFGELSHSGQPDVVHRLFTRALVVDYKTLTGDTPDSPRNLQLRDLAVLVHENLLVDEIAVCIVQPFVTHSPELCLYGKDDLRAAREQLRDRVMASNSLTAPRIPGELQCKFCLAKSKCVEYQRWAGQITPPSILRLLEVPLDHWTPEQRSLAMNAVKPAREFLDAIEDTVRTGLGADPAFCPGWELGPGRKTNKITDPQLVYQRFVALGGKHEAFMNAVQLLKGELRQALNDCTGARGQMLDRALETLIAGAAVTKESEPILRRVKE